MKKLSIIVVILAAPYIAWNLYFQLGLIFEYGVDSKSLFLLALLVMNLVVLGLVGAGLGAVVQAALIKIRESKDSELASTQLPPS
ncbi:MAG: hypothetical protein AAF368_00920 [Planctomycetota bacterium]